MKNSATVNQLSGTDEDEIMAPYTSIREVNGFSMPILRDTGSSIDVICLKVVKPEMFTGEHVWTKAAVVSNKADKGRYLPGNGTAAIIEKSKDFPVPQQVNAIQTRSWKCLEELKEITHVKERDPVTLEETELPTAEDIEIEDDLFSFPPKQEFEGLTLLKIDSKAFIAAQQSCKDSQSLTKNILEKTDAKNFKILLNGLLVKKKVNLPLGAPL
ncbi:hypothetical protein HNY73_005028 [Argiope bruennichi]|uniref:Uncharacterized protein n=1 Tax=Argiope bruennichi TaxID=94029 RepID=A0A8T0FHP0_ARGBR|nr:hypothetical protein HNY73_005028 [Argiope bruennichi]